MSREQLSPEIKRTSSLLKVFATLVNSSYAPKSARHMILDLVHNYWANAEPFCCVCREASPDVVKGPACNTTLLVEFCFCFGEPLNWSPARGAEKPRLFLEPRLFLYHG